MAAAGRGEQAQRRGRDQRRVLRRPHLRRRRLRAAPRHRRRDRDPAQAARTRCSRATGAGPRRPSRPARNWWYHTGDIGRIDDEDFLFFVDRKADYLRRRGENISSFDVERILMGHGALADVAVHAVPSEITEDDLKITATARRGDVGHRGGALPLVHRRAAVLRAAPLHRVPGRAAPQPGRPGAQARAARRGRHRRRPGTPRRAASPTRSAERYPLASAAAALALRACGGGRAGRRG